MKHSFKEILELIKTQGFYFYEIQLNALVHQLMEKHVFTETSYIPGKDAGLSAGFIEDSLSNEMIRLLAEPFEKSELHYFKTLSYTAHKFKFGESMDLHSDYIERGEYQILTWLCEKEDFIGREFIYGNREADQIMKIRPRNGLVCILDLRDKKFVHGVGELKSNHSVITICGSLYN